MTAPRRAALYARVSTLHHGQDVGLQLDDLRQMAATRGWTVVGEFTDEGVSGSRDSRPALNRMLDEVHKGRVDVVAVWRIDRLARSLANLLRVLDDLSAKGVDFVSVHNPGMDTTSSTGRLLTQMLGAFAEFERSITVERVRAGIARARSKGVVLGRPEVEVDVDRARALLAKGATVAAVARQLGTNARTLRRRLRSSP